jgi:uncharacterized membrane protein
VRLFGQPHGAGTGDGAAVQGSTRASLEWPWPLLAGFIGCGLFLSALSILKYRAFNMGLDFGNMYQSIWSTCHGHLLEMTRTDNGENISRLFGHVEAVYLLLLPAFALFPRGETLLVLQAFALSAGGLAVFWIARHAALGRGPALFLAFAYWCFPYLLNVAVADFHGDSFLVFPHLMAWYSLRRGWRARFWIFILLGAACKEYAFLFNLTLAVLIFRGHRREALGLVGLSLAQFLVVTPLLSQWATRGAFQLQMQEHVVPRTAASVWAHFAANAMTFEYARNVLSLLLILNFSLIFFRRGMVLWLPLLLGLTLANDWGLFSNHRHALLIAPLFICLVEGAARAPAAWKGRYALWGVFAPALVMNLFYPGSALAQNLSEVTYKRAYKNEFHYRYTDHDHMTDSLLAGIPPGAAVASDLELRSKLAARRFAYVHPFPRDSTRADHYLFDFFESLALLDQPPRLARCTALLRSGAFTVQSHLDGLLFMARDGGDSGRPFSWRRLPGESSDTGGLTLDSTGVASVSGGFVMTALLRQGTRASSAQEGGEEAIVSFFISERDHDTLRVLHLPAYVFGRLDSLPPGRYEEKFFFQVPRGKSLSGRTHSAALFRRQGMLTFFARPEFLLRRL